MAQPSPDQRGNQQQRHQPPGEPGDHQAGRSHSHGVRQLLRLRQGGLSGGPLREVIRIRLGQSDQTLRLGPLQDVDRGAVGHQAENRCAVCPVDPLLRKIGQRFHPGFHRVPDEQNDAECGQRQQRRADSLRVAQQPHTLHQQGHHHGGSCRDQFVHQTDHHDGGRQSPAGRPQQS